VVESLWLEPRALERLVRSYLTRLFPDRESLLGTDKLKTLRLAGDARRELLGRMKAKRVSASLTDRRWMSWLKGGEPLVQVTLDREAARDDSSILLLTAAHPLVRQAAEDLAGDQPLQVSLRVYSAAIPAGCHSFAMYQWRMTGFRADSKLVSVSQHDAAPDLLFPLVADADDAQPIPLEGAEIARLDALHHALWSEARRTHRNETAAASAFRRESFLSSHKTRIASLQEFERGATEARIRKMRAAQIASAEAEAQHRLAAFAKAEKEADILFRPVVYGVLEVQSR